MDTKVYWPMIETIAWYENGLSIGEPIEYTLSEEDRVAGASLAFVLTLMDETRDTGEISSSSPNGLGTPEKIKSIAVIRFQ